MTTPSALRCSSAACVTSAGPMALVAMTSCQVPAEISSSGASGDTPVAYTRASSPPIASTASPTSSRQRSPSLTSAAIPVPVPAVATTSASFSGLRPTTVMFAPARGRQRGAAADAGGAADDEDALPRQIDVDAHGATSSTIAEPIPPPAHMDTTPSVVPWRRSSLIIVTTMRAPVAAIG